MWLGLMWLTSLPTVSNSFLSDTLSLLSPEHMHLSLGPLFPLLELSSLSSSSLDFLENYLFLRLHHILGASHRIFTEAWRIQFPGQRPNPGPPALGVQSLSHWTTREVPSLEFLFSPFRPYIKSSHFHYSPFRESITIVFIWEIACSFPFPNSHTSLRHFGIFTS